jgi:hypothetical protein
MCLVGGTPRSVDCVIAASVLVPARTVGRSSARWSAVILAPRTLLRNDERLDVNDWVCGNCKSINRASANSCYSCGGAREIVAVNEPRPLGAGQFGVQPLGSTSMGGGALAAAEGQPGAAVPVAPGISGVGALAGTGAFGAPAGATQPRQPASTRDILGGLLAGLVAAVLATGLWYAVVVVSHYQLGIIAIVVGFLVGQGVVLGAGRRGSVILVAISVVLTLLALVISEYLIVAAFVTDQLGAGETIEVLQPPSFVIEVVVESVKADPLTLAFWAIALFQAFTIPARQLGRTATA